MTKQQWQTDEINKLSKLVDNYPDNKNKVLLLSSCLNYVRAYGEQDLFTYCKIVLCISGESFDTITIYKL